MIKIICDEEMELIKTEDFKVRAFKCDVKMRGDKDLCAHQLAATLAHLIKSEGEFMDIVLKYLGEDLNVKSD